LLHCFSLFALLLPVFVHSAAPPHYVRTPVGLVWSECIHKTSSHVHVIESAGRAELHHDDGTVQNLPRCSMPTLPNSARKSPRKAEQNAPDDGWQVWTAFNNYNNASFTSFLGNFNVPADPTSFDGGILYMFTGLQNDNWVPISGEWPTPPAFEIIQPVLQYGGDSEDGGGNYWSLASWYVTVDNGAVWSTLINVNAGDVIFGNMTQTGPTSWFISGQIVGQTGPNSTTSISVTHNRLVTNPWAYCTLEVYEIDNCSTDFPPSGSQIKFTQMQLFARQGRKIAPVTPKWQSLNNNGDHCSTSITVTNAATVTINF